MNIVTDNSSLPDDTSIWHYRQFAEFVSILQNQALWFSRLDHLRDPFEGRFAPTYTGAFWEAAEAHTRKKCASCWFIDGEESELMWCAYAPGFGVAIHSTRGRLKESLKSPDADEIVIRDVEYDIDWSKGRPDFAFVKQRAFQQEKELRALVPHEHEYNPRVVEPSPAGKLVPVEVSSLIDEVWVAPYLPDWFKAVVEAELRKYGYDHIPVKRRE